MRTMNPALNDKTFERAHDEWAPPSGQPVGLDDSQRMTFSGTLTATAVMLALMLTTAVFGWGGVEQTPGADFGAMPGFFWGALILWIGAALVTIFKPKMARITAPIYALAVGYVLGAISAVYNLAFEGIVLQAVGLTIGVLVVMLFLYATRIIKVTEKLRMGIIAATMAIALVYVVSILANWIFGAQLFYLHDTGTMGILISLVIVGVASFNLLLDFDLIENGVKAGAPKYMEWFAAFGLMVTLVWLYLEMLRLLAKLRSD
ncbi:MAG: Bax inhibitor-1/YccA family protein [Acidimicrobiales bacterium]